MPDGIQMDYFDPKFIVAPVNRLIKMIMTPGVPSVYKVGPMQEFLKRRINDRTIVTRLKLM